MADTPAENPAVDAPIEGRFITLEKFTEGHVSDLWHDFGLDESTWHWLPGAPPNSEEELRSGFKEVSEEGNIVLAVMGDPDYLNPAPEGHTVDSERKRKALGVMFYGDMKLQQRTIEVGAILGLKIRRTVASTEAHYLLLRNIFNPKDGPSYRRVAWKTNSFNVTSRRAAQRLGYVHEGTWRNHMIDRGQSRDSDWLSMIDDDWPIINAALEQWLDPKNFDGDGKQIKKLEEIRRSLK